MKLLSAACCLLLLASAAHATSKTYTVKPHHKTHAKGLKVRHHEMQAMRHRSFKDAPQLIPQSVDLSKEVSLPEDQGQCGACWDFSLTKALRSEEMLAGKKLAPLEFNYLLNNCNPKGPQMDGCQGGDFTAAASFEGGAGPGLEAKDPFTGKQGPCKHLPVKATALSYAMLGEGQAGPSFKDLAYAVGVERHVLSIDVAAGQGEWEDYAAGIYNDCQGAGSDVDHMINLVGYDCESSIDADGYCLFDALGKPAKGDGYLLVMNNWGEDWGVKATNGHGGYMKTRMYAPDGTNCNAIATDALLFTIK